MARQDAAREKEIDDIQRDIQRLAEKLDVRIELDKQKDKKGAAAE